MTPLGAILGDRIRRDGPVPLEAFMALSLGHPEHGYYRARAPFGPAGDFTTTPEISQIFGELIGLWLAQVWRDQGGPRPARLIELGPGRGALMADAARAAARAAPDFLEAAELILVETSPALRAAQAERLSGRAARWVDALGDALGDGGAVFLVANEFFDALPIRQHRFVDGAWREVLVGCDGARFVYTLGPPDPAIDAERRLPAPREGAVLETCPAGRADAARLGAALAAADAGAALIVDYGYAWSDLRAAGGRDTFQAVRDHRPADPLEAPGAADLTAHVDFEALARAAGAPTRLRASGPVGQGAFLRALGAEARLAHLAQANPDRAETLAAGLHRLTHPAEMGRLFQALALTPHAAPPPPGFPLAAPFGGDLRGDL